MQALANQLNKSPPDAESYANVSHARCCANFACDLLTILRRALCWTNSFNQRGLEPKSQDEALAIRCRNASTP
jgi:hypothetical protein